MTILTQQRLKELLHYDPIKGIFTRLTRSAQVVRIGDVAGGIDVHGYIQINVDGKLYMAHRLVWLYMTGNWPPEDIDHINGERDDNRWSNLRLATRAENLRNTAIRSDNTSGHKGVAWSKKTSQWRAYIQVNGKTISLGHFDAIEDAIAARKAGELMHHGKFARIS